jgi:hypothetical protein
LLHLDDTEEENAMIQFLFGDIGKSGEKEEVRSRNRFDDVPFVLIQSRSRRSSPEREM